jgi:murein DD-endopeptidase MepM/ murein hydrolase activator NlpD
MGLKHVNILKIYILFFLFSGITSSIVHAQDYRLSAGYSVQNLGFNYVPNPGYSGEINASAKGMIEVELERYLFYRFYLSGKTEYLIHHQKDLFLGGPVNFEQLNLGASVGLQWPKFGIYGGVKAGALWDITVKAKNQNGDVSWVEPLETTGAVTTAFTGGIKYYLLNFLRLQFEVTNTFNLPQDVIVQDSFNERTVFRSFDYNPLSFSVGISLSIPWNKRKKKTGSETKLPPLMSITGVNFSPPIKNSFVTSPFGPRWNSNHEGIDLDAKLRQKIYAAEKGIVVKAGKGRGYGKMVRIKHSRGYETVYAHMSRISVKEGDRVRKGDVVGKAGNTGTSTGIHLHFEILKDGKHVNPLSYVRFK